LPRELINALTEFERSLMRHACGFKLAHDGHDTRAIQEWLGHRNIQHTTRYAELSSRSGSKISGRKMTDGVRQLTR
jgi:site-specific recombinase XerD